MDQIRTDKLIQYILAVAARGWGDCNDKEIGPIHIIKHAYLADLAFAMRHGGKIFTGVPWRFFHFGPWDEGFFNRIEPSCAAIGAHKKIISGGEYNDFVRWHINDSHLESHLKKKLPREITFAIKGNFTRLSTVTNELLDYVYLTIPMRNAAPGEKLSFDIAVSAFESQKEEKEMLSAYQKPQLTAREQKKRKHAFMALRKKIQAKIADREKMPRKGFVKPTPPRYDELFWEGQKWLDSLAGSQITPEEGELTVDDSVWKSQSRREPYV